MKRILITGISKGLGKELFIQLSEKNYFVYGILRDQEVFEEMSLSIPPNTKIFLADISTDECISVIRENVGNEKIDLVINNAGIAGKEFELAYIESDEILQLFNTHYLGAFRVAKALYNNFLQDYKTTVINLNSRLGSIHRQHLGTYTNLKVSYSYRIAKASQNMLTNCLKQEFKDVIWISLMPGKLKTQISQTDADVLPSEAAQRIVEFWETGRFTTQNGITTLNDDIIEW